MTFSRNACLILMTCSLLAACASAPKVKPATAVDEAANALQQARRHHVDDYDAPDLKQARTQLKSARAALKAGKMDRTRHLAAESELTVQLATLRARATRAKANMLSVQRQIEHMENVSGAGS